MSDTDRNHRCALCTCNLCLTLFDTHTHTHTLRNCVFYLLLWFGVFSFLYSIGLCFRGVAEILRRNVTIKAEHSTMCSQKFSIFKPYKQTHPQSLHSLEWEFTSRPHTHTHTRDKHINIHSYISLCVHVYIYISYHICSNIYKL